MELARLEKKFGIHNTNIARSQWLKRVEKRRSVKSEDFGKVDVPRFVLNKENAWNGPWPTVDNFLTSEMRTQIRILYARDFEHYFNGQ